MSYTLVPRGKKGLLCAVWYEPDPKRPGKQRQRWKATGTAKRVPAEKMAALWSEAGRSRKMGEMFTMRTVALQREIAGAAGAVSMKVFVTGWLKRQELQVKPVTMDFYRPMGKIWLDWLATQRLADADMGLVTKTHVEAYLALRRGQVAAKTANHTIKFLRAVFRSAVEQRVIADNPALLVKPFRQGVDITPADKAVARQPRRIFTETELEALLGVADAEWESMIMIGLHLGQRLKDIATLTRRQVEMAAGEVEFTTSKTGKVVRPALGTPLLAFLKRRGLPDDPEAPLHPKAHASVMKTGRTTTLSTQFGDLCAAAGLRPKISRHPKKAERKGRDAQRRSLGLSYHCLRHTHNSLMKLAGASAAVAMENTGHSDKETSRIYTHVDTATRRKYADLLPDLLKSGNGKAES